jgi:transcriptional regulator with XRE-family HTH domain
VSEDPDLLLRAIGLRVLRRREELGLTQQSVADRLGIAPQNIYRIEHGQQNLTVRTLVKVAEALGVTVAELIVGPEELRGRGR